MVVAERAGNRRAPGEILADEWPDNILLETLFLVDDVVGNAEVFGHAAGVIDVIQRTAAAGLGRVGDAVLAGQAGLVPELESEADDCIVRNGGAVVAAGEDRRDRRGVNSSGHGDGDGVDVLAWLNYSMLQAGKSGRHERVEFCGLPPFPQKKAERMGHGAFLARPAYPNVPASTGDSARRRWTASGTTPST